ncbi:MAG: tripartite tricarboxylate transporter substrate binding protein [bacterium]|jgi:tripartite-type tricarboxylate transporter receptor subunit TctC
MNRRLVIKLAAIVLCLLVSFAALAGCSSGTQQGQQQQEEPAPSTAEKFPNKPLTVYIQFAAGGATDQVVRVLAAEMQNSLGVPVNCVNMPGATGGVATAYVMGQPHDGYSLIGNSDNVRMFQVMDLGDTSYKDLHLWTAAAGVTCLCVRPDSPIKTLDDWLETMETKGADFTVSTSGVGNGWHISMEVLKNATGTDYSNVPYSGGRPAITAAMSGEVDATAAGLMEAIDFIKGGQIVCLATFNDKPIEIQGVGTIPSIGDKVPEIKQYLPFGGWWGLAAPNDIPQEALEAIDKAYAEAIESPKFKEFLEQQTMVWLGYDRQKSKDLAKQETEFVSWLLHDLGLAKKSPDSVGIPKP